MENNKSVLGMLVGLSIAAIFLGTIFITGMQTLVSANTTGFSAEQILIWGVLGLIVVLCAIIVMLKYVGIKI